MSREPFEALFEGAAHAGLLFGGLDIGIVPFAEFVPHFVEELAAYMELSVSPTGALGVMTRGDGVDYTHRVARHLEYFGATETQLRQLLVRAQHLEHRNLFFKLEIDHQGLAECSYYFRRRPTLDVAHAWLADAGVEEPERRMIDAVAHVLSKQTVHFIATSIGRDSASDKVYFSQAPSADTWVRLAHAAELLGVDDAWWPLAAQEGALRHQDTYLSFGYSDGKLLPTAKIDVAHPSEVAVDSLMLEVAGVAVTRERVDMLLAATARQRPDYLGIRMRPDGRIELSAYATLTG